jgi:hypothetical protein
MPAIFPRGEPAALRSVLEGDAGKQKDALWGHFAQAARVRATGQRTPASRAVAVTSTSSTAATKTRP